MPKKPNFGKKNLETIFFKPQDKKPIILGPLFWALSNFFTKGITVPISEQNPT